MPKSCLGVGAVVAAGAVAVFTACCGFLYRSAYVAGYAAGRRDTTQVMRKILEAAEARDIYAEFAPDLIKLIEGLK